MNTSYSEFVVYDIRSAFEKEPPYFTNCPFCKASLTRSSLEPSVQVKADMGGDWLIPVHDGTRAFICQSCHWWCVREQWSLYECIFASYDYLVTGILRYWDITNVLEPLAIATEYLQQNHTQLSLIAKDIENQEQTLTKVISQYWPEITACYIGEGADEKGAYNLFLINNTLISFIVILSQTVSGWLNLEVVETVNGYFPTTNSNQLIELTCINLINRNQAKNKIRRRTCNAEIKNLWLESIFESNSNDHSSWGKISHLPYLYDSPRKLPESLKRAFIN